METFQVLYADHHRHVRKTLYWMVGMEPVDDLCQEVFLKVWKSQKHFRSRSTSRTWIHRITVNVALDYLRKHQHSSLKQQVDLEESTPGLTVTSSVEIRQVIELGVAKLDEGLRVCFVSFYKLGLTISEIAESLQIPEGTVKSRLFNARNQFVAFLNQNGVSYE